MSKKVFPLAKLDSARKALAQATDLSEVRKIRDFAEAFRICARLSGEGLEAQNYGAEIRLRAERRAGEMLADMDIRPGQPKKELSQPVIILSDLGVTLMQSSRWQLEASVQERVSKHKKWRRGIFV